MSKTLFAGPYFGEFGHEVLGSGLLRPHARPYDRVIVCSRPSRAALYDDIATEFQTHDIKCTAMCDRATRATMPSKEKIASYIEPGADHFPMPNCGDPYTEEKIIRLGVYYQLGVTRDEWRGVAVFHARSRLQGSERNWSQRLWHKLARWILREGIAERIVCVGTRDAAFMAEGCCDMRGSDLRTQMDIGASALFVVGPSSGWMHLASLCGCPHLTWVGGKEEVYVTRRYEDRWNPFRTHVDVIKDWQPTFEVVCHRLKPFLKDKRRADQCRHRHPEWDPGNRASRSLCRDGLR